MKVKKFFNEPSITKQSFKESCDVNNILKKYRNVTNENFLDRYNGFVGGQFGDFSQVGDYHTALTKIIDARAAFEALPLKLKERFNNDPEEMVEYFDNQEKLHETGKMGVSPVVADNKSGVEPQKVLDVAEKQVQK